MVSKTCIIYTLSNYSKVSSRFLIVYTILFFLFVVLFVIRFLKYMKCSRIIVVVFTPPNFRFSLCNATGERQDIRGEGVVSHEPPAIL